MQKDTIIFVNAIRPATFEALQEFEKQTGRVFNPVVLVDKKIHSAIFHRNGQYKHAEKIMVLSADFDSAVSVRAALRPYTDRIFAITCQYENSIFELQKLVPFVPYLSLPTETSLDWATEKKLMRSMLEAYDHSLVPQYFEVTDISKNTLLKIEKNLSYPLIIKPSGLEGSLLVSLVKNRGELETTLKHTFSEIQKGYDTWLKRQTPSILVEEFMQGDMYSVDTYVSTRGECTHTPLVRVVTGHKIGFDDFFGYMRVTPTELTKEEVSAALKTATQACRALALRSVTAHVELMKTSKGWRIIEVGPRVGGYRHDIYQLSYGINHIMNDILNRADEQPDVPTKLLRHTAVFNIYAPQEGILKQVHGIDAIQKLPSYVSHSQVIGLGELTLFAKNNGDPVFEITLSHPTKAQFDVDITKLEKEIGFAVEPHTDNLA